MDLTSTLRGDAFRPFATVVAPGAIGLSPWAVYLYTSSDVGRAFWDVHPIAMGVGLFICSVAAGLVFENLGARFESMIDAHLQKLDGQHNAIWSRYLLLVFDKEPIGQRYLRTVLFRLKFELGFLGSIPFQVTGWTLVVCVNGGSRMQMLIPLGVGAALAVWFGAEALSSAKLLAGIRRDLVGRFEVPPTA